MYLQACRQDFPTFAAAAFAVLHPGQNLDVEWSIKAMCRFIQDLLAGRTPRALIMAPPRMLKSMICSVMLPAFLLGRDPSARILAASYAMALAQDHSRDTRRLMQSAFYRAVFPNTHLDKVTDELLTTTARGQRLATSVGGPILGFGADTIIIDDPLNAEEAYSTIERARASRFISNLTSRFNTPSQGRMIVVMQRLHEDDPAGRLLKRPRWRHLKLQAIATADQIIELGEGLTHHVRMGDLLAPQRLTQEILDERLEDLGPHAFAAQYQQEPVPADGAIVKRAWLCYYDAAPGRQGSQVVLSLDTATKTNPANDYSVVTVWLKGAREHHLIDVWRDRVDYPDLKQKVLDLCDVHGADVLLVEDHGNGSSLLQEFGQSPSGIMVVGWRPTSTKEARLASASAFIHSGQMLLPREAHWRPEFEDELLGFPAAKHDDQVDSVSQYFAWVRGQPKGFFSYDTGDGDGGDDDGGGAEEGFDHEALAERLIGWRGRF